MKKKLPVGREEEALWIVDRALINVGILRERVAGLLDVMESDLQRAKKKLETEA